MTTIKANCETCGNVDLTDKDVQLMVCDIPALTYYTFGCPTCRIEVRKLADQHVVALLMSAGVRGQVWTVPAEARESHHGQPVNSDDLIDFALELAACADVAGMAACWLRQNL